MEKINFTRKTVRCTCSRLECGKSYEVTRLFLTHEEADKWEAEMKHSTNVCYDCFKREAELIYEIRLDVFGAYRRAEDRIAIVFDGKGTYAHKDEIKALGAKWYVAYPNKDVTTDLRWSGGSEPARWVLWTDSEHLDEWIKAVEAIGATAGITPAEADRVIWREALRLGREKFAQLGPEPEWPDKIKAAWPKGARWNGWFYGGRGKWRVYLGGNNAVQLTDAEKAEMESASKARAEWRKAYSDLREGK